MKKITASVPRLIIHQLTASATVDDLDEVADQLGTGEPAEKFTYKRTVKTLLDLAPILNEIASAFRAFGFRPISPTRYRDDAWQASIELKGLTVTVDFSPV